MLSSEETLHPITVIEHIVCVRAIDYLSCCEINQIKWEVHEEFMRSEEGEVCISPSSPASFAISQRVRSATVIKKHPSDSRAPLLQATRRDHLSLLPPPHLRTHYPERLRGNTDSSEGPWTHRTRIKNTVTLEHTMLHWTVHLSVTAFSDKHQWLSWVVFCSDFSVQSFTPRGFYLWCKSKDTLPRETLKRCVKTEPAGPLEIYSF